MLCMTVFPGFGGQAFMDEVLPKVAQVRRALDERGRGTGWTSRWTGASTRPRRPASPPPGADVFVAGSAVFGRDRPWEAVEAIRRSAQNWNTF